MAQILKCLHCKHKDQILIPWTQVLKTEGLSGSCNPNNGEVERKRIPGIYLPDNLP